MAHRTWRVAMIGAAMVLLLLTLVSHPRGLLAQDATPEAEGGHPAHIHAGTCADLDPNPKFPLANVVESQGDAEGATEAAGVEASVTTVEASLDDILAEPHAINVHESAENAKNYIACGEVGGVRLPEGAIAIGLREQNDSGEVGVAYLVPNPDNAAQTNVSVFLTTTEPAPASATAAATAENTPAAAAGGPVDVTFTEFKIDMPDTVPAGETTFNIKNDGEFPHNLEIEGEGIEQKLDKNLEGGESGTLTVDLKPGTYEVYCPVDGHRGRGMELKLTVQ